MRKLYLLKDLLTIKNGTDYREEKSGNIPVYGSGGIMTYIENYLYNGESILLPRKGTLNNIMYVNGKFWTVDTMYWSIINKNIANTYFLSNYLKCLNLEGIQTGSTLPSMTNTAYYGIPVLLPDLKEQNVIAKVLSSIDDKIALNNKINVELEQIAKTLYNYWFVQFEFPAGNEGAYKSSNGQMVYNEILKREIPVGWEVKTIGELCDVLTGKEDANFAAENGKYAFFTCGDEVLYCNKPAFKGKSILVAGNGNFNVKYYEGEFNAYQRTYVLIPNDEIYIGVMYKAMLDSINRFTKGSNGSIVKFITKGDISNTQVIIPSNKNLIKPLNTLLSSIEKNKKQNIKLVELRNFLLPLLMNGQIKVEQQKSDHS